MSGPEFDPRENDIHAQCAWEIHRLEDENKKLRKALEFYGDKDNYSGIGKDNSGVWFSSVSIDMGKIAREVFGEIK